MTNNSGTVSIVFSLRYSFVFFFFQDFSYSNCVFCVSWTHLHTTPGLTVHSQASLSCTFFFTMFCVLICMQWFSQRMAMMHWICWVPNLELRTNKRPDSSVTELLYTVLKTLFTQPWQYSRWAFISEKCWSIGKEYGIYGCIGCIRVHLVVLG